MQTRALQEIDRVLRPGGTFVMMEHDVPKNTVTRFLFYLRMTFIGAGRAISFLRRERDILKTHFSTVEKVLTPAGRSKIMICRKE